VPAKIFIRIFVSMLDIMRSPFYSFLVIFALLGSVSNLQAQEMEARSADFWGVSFAYGIDFSAGDMADRYGQHFHANMAIDLFKLKWNGIIRLEGALFFGDNVNEDVLSPYRNETGSILGNDGSYADVFLRQRGTYLGVMLNKVLLPLRQNPHAGLTAGLGFGLYQHNIRFNVDSNNAPQVEGDYGKGYDRNSIGPALKQNIGFMSIGKNKNVNYEVALSITEGFTRNNRPVNFDTGTKEDDRRLDIVIGLEFRWIIPLKDKQEPGEIFY